MNINDWMTKHKYAKNEFAAQHIFKGLELSKLPRFWARVHRVILYRRLRDSKAYKTTADCYAATLRGERPAELKLVTG